MRTGGSVPAGSFSYRMETEERGDAMNHMTTWLYERTYPPWRVAILRKGGKGLQDEINSKTVALVINISKKGVHLTAELLKAAMRKYLRDM